ncbi:hypothetical protein V8C26DRAFT_198811 [Trichoderma gracile]
MVGKKNNKRTRCWADKAKEYRHNGSSLLPVTYIITHQQTLRIFGYAFCSVTWAFSHMPFVRVYPLFLSLFRRFFCFLYPGISSCLLAIERKRGVFQARNTRIAHIAIRSVSSHFAHQVSSHFAHQENHRGMTSGIIHTYIHTYTWEAFCTTVEHYLPL